ILEEIGGFPSKTYYFGANLLEKFFVNSDGTTIRGRRLDTYISYNIIAFKPGKGTVHRWNAFAGTVGWELIKEEKPEECLEMEARKLHEILDKATKPPTGELDIVLGSEVVGLMVHESCGHPSEADRIMGREAAQAGESYMKPDMIGKRIGTNVVNICDDPTIPKSYGYYLYDDEGVKARKRELFKNGYINEFLHNRETAAIFGLKSNGSARASSYNREPIIRMANTYFVPGDYSLEELIEDVRRGIYMKSYMEWNIDDRRWSQRYVGLEAYLIENGELKGLVKNPALEITTGGLYSSIDAVGKSLKFYPGTCGKGDPGQGVPVWFGGPEVRLRNVRLSISL
ncbi:MAG TPA: TldD/PmbA family protein, partial [Thermoprotei archaeon]|nr:TldD/PmbA family protein [Thermoprotei archaeon]